MAPNKICLLNVGSVRRKSTVTYCAVCKNLEYFSSVGPNWSKLNIIYYMRLINFWMKWGKGYVMAAFYFCLCLQFRVLISM